MSDCNDCGCEHEHDQEQESAATGVANPAVIDLFGLDSRTDQVLLIMNEPRPWDGGDAQLLELQEKLNAYVSFLLDGEMTSEYPELAGKRARIEVHCAEMPEGGALELLRQIHDQLALQEIAMEVVVRQAGGCGAGCACHDN